MKKIINIAIVIIFTSIITLPMVFSDKSGGKQANWENRILATFPKIYTNGGRINPKLLLDFEAWANDNIAMRAQALKASMYIKFGLFDVSPQTDVYVGNDGWMYNTSQNGIQNYQRINTPSNTTLNDFAQKCQSMSDALAKGGIPSFFIVYPSKETIYPEYFPKSIIQANNCLSNTDKIYNYIKQNTSVDITYIKDTMLAQKKGHVLYSKAADIAHWNSYGAYIGYLELMKKVSEFIPDTKILSPDSMDIKEKVTETNIYGLKKTSETDYSVTPKSGYHAQSAKDSLNIFETNDIWNSHNRYINSDTSLPKALIVGDSFTWMFMLPNIAESFSDLTFIHFLDISHIEDYVNNLKPDIVIFSVRDTDLAWIENFGSYTFSDNKIFSLPEKDDVQEMYNGMIVDAVNGRNLKEQGKIELSKTDAGISMYGWAADFNAKLPASALYVKAGDKIYKADYGISRTSVSDYYKDPALENTGFEITLPKEVLNGKEISFIIVSNDGSYRFKEIPYTLEMGN
ncbi:MAG TPA: hypothetical protein VHT96_04980 [Clostridia bacterium]|nr:hypothetical protein [Clostridia bacterium]